MILDVRKNARLYDSLSPNFATAFEWLLQEDIDSFEAPQVVRIDGERVFAQIQSYESLDPKDQRFESHRKYADIQYMQRGSETILWTPIDVLKTLEEYDPETDNMFYRDAPATELKMAPGYFSVFLPEDGHKPRCILGGREQIGKIVMKVAL